MTGMGRPHAKTDPRVRFFLLAVLVVLVVLVMLEVARRAYSAFSVFLTTA